MKPMIIMPVYNDLKYFKMAVDSIFQSTEQAFTLVIIESESNDGSAEYADSIIGHGNKEFDQDIEVIHTKKEGPMAAMNLGFKLSLERKRDVYFTQTDVIHTKMFDRDWLLEYIQIGSMHDCGIATCLGGGGIAAGNYVAGFNWVGGWSTYIPYTTIEKLGGYDENMLIGWGADIEYSWRIVYNGLRIYRIDYWVYHHRKTPHLNDQNNKLEEIDRHNSEYFRRKFKL
jgi:GT2 family glycosyltransferase